MDFHRHSPAPPLDRFVDHMWLVRTERMEHPRQVLFPDGGITLHFNLGAPPGLVERDGGAVRRFETSFVSGERTAPYTLDLPGPVAFAGVRFHPGRAFPMLGLPASELRGEVVDLDLVFGSAAHEIRERIAEATPKRSFDTIERALLRRLHRLGAEVPATVTAALRALADAPASSSVVRLASDLGVTHRTLLRHFDRWVGVRPKVIQRILRFQRVIRWEDDHVDLDWSEVAYRCGYYDQAHLIRDFRAFTGITPVAYRKSRLEYPNYVPEPA